MTSINFGDQSGHSTWYVEGFPLDSIGRNGDYAEDVTTGKRYGPKENGVWPNTFTAITGGSSGGSSGSSSSGVGTQGEPGVGVPPGGDSDWLLAKKTPADFDTEWRPRVDAVARWDTKTTAVDFTADPGLTGPYVLTNPNGVSEYPSSIVDGRYRLTSSASTDANLRLIRGVGDAGMLGNSEMRSTWFDSSVDLNDDAIWQPGHAHRVTAGRVAHLPATATAGGASTLTDSGQAWTTNEFAGSTAEEVEWYVTITDGTGVGQTRRIVSNTATQLTVSAAWATNPNATSEYEVWSWHVRAIVWAANVISGAHYIINCYVWDGRDFTIVGGVNLSDYLYPGSVYTQFPWQVKTRVVGNVTDFAVWLPGDPEPSYDAPDQSGSFTLPDGWGAPGECGLYLGHVPTSGWMEFDDVTVTGVSGDGLPAGLQTVRTSDFPDGEVVIDPDAGSMVWLVVDSDCQIMGPGPALSTPSAELRFLISQVDDEPHGCFFRQPEFIDPPAIDPEPGSSTVATFSWIGLGWQCMDGSVSERHGLQVIGWDETPGFEGLHIDASAGDFVLAVVQPPGGAVFPPTNPTNGQFLTIEIVQDTGDGVVFDSIFQDAPLVDPAAGAVTTATFRYNGAVWVRDTQSGGSHDLQVLGWTATTGIEGLHIDASAGDFVLAVVESPGGAVYNPTNPTPGQFLTIELVQDTGFGVIFDTAFQDAPLVDPAPGAVTTTTWRYNGAVWVRDTRDAEEYVAQPALVATLLPDFSDNRTGWNGAPWSQDDTTLGAAYGSAEQYHIWWRRGDPFAIDIDNTAVIARRQLPGGTWDEYWPMKSTAWRNEMGTSDQSVTRNGLGEPLHRPFAGTPDDHNSFAIGVAEDGFLFACGNQHSDPMHFVRSAIPVDEWVHGVDPGWVPGLLTPRDGDGSRKGTAAAAFPTTNVWNGTTYSSVKTAQDAWFADWNSDYMAAQEGEVTYPSFVRLASGTLLFLYRNGYSGSSSGWCMDRYTPSGTPGVAGTWARIGGTHFLTSVDANYGAGSTSFYPLRFVAHPTLDRVAVFGTWRQGGVADNRYLSFAWLVNLDGAPAALNADLTPRSLPLTQANMERVPGVGEQPYEMMNSGGADVDELGRPHASIYLPDGVPTDFGTQTMQLAHVYWDGDAWQSPLVTNIPNRMELFATNVQSFSTGVESGGQVTLSGIPAGHGFFVGNRVNVFAADDRFDTSINDNYKLTAVTATSITYDAPAHLDGTGATTGAGTVTRSVKLPFTRNPLFCANGRTYMLYMTNSDGRQGKLLCMDVTDSGHVIEAPLALDLPLDENALDSRALAERREVHIAVHPGASSPGASASVYADQAQFQEAWMLTLDCPQMSLVMSSAVGIPQIRPVLPGASLSGLEPNYISGRGLQVRGQTPKHLLGLLPIHDELQGKLVFARIRAQVMNSNAGFRGEVRVCYVIGEDTNDPPLDFLGPTVFTSIGTTGWQHLTSLWTPIVHTALYDGAIPDAASGFVLVTLNAKDDDRTVIARAATLELGVRDNVSGRITAYSGTV